MRLAGGVARSVDVSGRLARLACLEAVDRLGWGSHTVVGLMQGQAHWPSGGEDSAREPTVRLFVFCGRDLFLRLLALWFLRRS